MASDSNTAQSNCAATLAVFALTWNSTLLFFTAGAAVDVGFAIVDAVSGAEPYDKAIAGATRLVGAAVVKGALYGVTNAIAKGVISKSTGGKATAAAGPAVMAVGLVGVIGYQAYDKGWKEGLKAGALSLVPTSCQATYKNIAQLPRKE